MNRVPYRRDASTGMSPRLRLIVIAICTLILCSCRPFLSGNRPPGWTDPSLPSPAPASSTPVLGEGGGDFARRVTLSQPGNPTPVPAQDDLLVVSDSPQLPGQIHPPIPSGPVPPQGPMWVDAQGHVLPRGVPPGAVAGAWTPPGIEGPWPQDEFLADGGDLPPYAGLAENGVAGLNAEDTVARFQTADGTTRVQPFNRVFIYSPRFGSVRQVLGLQANEQADKVAGVHTPTSMARIEEVDNVATSTQNYQARAGVQRRGVGQFESGQRDGVVSQVLGPRGFSDGFKPYENFSLIVKGIAVGDEMPALAQSVWAAKIWSSGQNVQVVINGRAASEEVSITRLHSLYRVESRYGEGKLRLVKVASSATAQPGETVDFTLRFDNVGTLAITELVIIDNLSTRLEYVEGSSQSSKAAELTVQPNEAGSVTLQWKLTEPLPPGEGGVIRFQCRVR